MVNPTNHPTEASPRGQRSRPVLVIIDDDRTVLTSLRIALGTRFEVFTFSTPYSGVVFIQENDPDALLLDIRMPQHDGFWVFSEVRKFNRRVPIVFNSAFQDVMSPGTAGEIYKPFAYLPKNGHLKELVGVLENACAQQSRG